MRKPTKDYLDIIEFSDSAEEIIKSAFASTNPVEALKQLTGLLKGKAFLTCEATKYSRSTGEPIRFDWKPYEKWDGRLWLGVSSAGSPTLEKNNPLYKALLEFLPIKKAILVKVGGKKFVIQHIPSRDEGTWQNGGTVPNHIKFTEVEEI